MSFSENLQFLRTRNSITQEQLAEQLDVSRQSVSKWESGASFPEMDTLLRICDLYSVDLDTLLRGSVEASLRQLGFDIRVSRVESHLCCGSAGTYSLLQPEISHQLRERKLGTLHEACTKETPPAAILSANIGCITHLQAGTDVPVRHWIEVIDDALQAANKAA